MAWISYTNDEGEVTFCNADQINLIYLEHHFIKKYLGQSNKHFIIEAGYDVIIDMTNGPELEIATRVLATETIRRLEREQTDNWEEDDDLNHEMFVMEDALNSRIVSALQQMHTAGYVNLTKYLDGER